MAIRPPQPVKPIPRDALDYFRQKGLRPAFSYLDVWKEEHNYAFTVAKVMEKGVLETLRTSLDKALARGETFKMWAEKARETLNDSGWASYGTPQQEPSRLLKIFSTNMRVARAVGQWQRIQRTKAFLPYLMYTLGPSEVHRPLHEEWDGLILSVDDPWWDEHYPPNGWGCKCGVRQLTAREAEERGVDVPPEDEYEQYVDPETGETEEVPVGVDPGWDFNPGKERQQQLEEEAS